MQIKLRRASKKSVNLLKMPKVSVIIPAFNVEKFIQQSIESVLIQTEQDLEIILVNDGSTDSTLQIAEALAANDPRLHIISQPNSGKPSVARNVGLTKAEGEYICFLDGDDLYKLDKVEKEIAVLDKYPEIDVVFHDMDVVSAEGEKQGETYLNAVNFQELAKPYFEQIENNIFWVSKTFYNFMSIKITAIHTSSVMIRRRRLDQEEYWFPEDMLIGEDIDLWFRMVKGRRVMFIDEPLSAYRQHDDNITKNNEKMLRGSIIAYSRNFNRAVDVLSAEEKNQYKRRIASQYQILGYLYFNSFLMGEARKAYLQAMQWSASYKAVLGFTKTFAPKWLIRLYRRHSTAVSDV